MADVARVERHLLLNNVEYLMQEFCVKFYEETNHIYHADLVNYALRDNDMLVSFRIINKLSDYYHILFTVSSSNKLRPYPVNIQFHDDRCGKAYNCKTPSELSEAIKKIIMSPQSQQKMHDMQVMAMPYKNRNDLKHTT